MRYGLLALSIAMLTSGGVTARSALSISDSASALVAADTPPRPGYGTSYGSLPYSLARAERLARQR